MDILSFLVICFVVFLELLALIFGLLFFTIFLEPIFNTLALIIRIVYIFLNFGKVKAVERIFNFKKNGWSKTFKIFGGTSIPFVNTISLYFDVIYFNKEKKIEIKNKIEQKRNEEILLQEEMEKEMLNEFQEESLLNKDEELKSSIQNQEENKKKINPWISFNKIKYEKPGIEKNVGSEMKGQSKSTRETIYESIGNIKTGLDLKDYEDKKSDFSQIEAYENLNQEKNNNLIRQNKLKKEKDELLNEIRKEKIENSQKEENDLFQKRFGEDALKRKNKANL